MSREKIKAAAPAIAAGVVTAGLLGFLLFLGCAPNVSVNPPAVTVNVPPSQSTVNVMAPPPSQQQQATTGVVVEPMRFDRAMPNERTAFEKIGVLRATAGTIAIISNVGKSVSQYQLPFTGNTYAVNGAQAPYAETSVAVGTPLLFTGGIGNEQVANMGLLYFLSDQNDATATFYANSAGTGAGITTINLTAGVPYEWDTSSGTSTLPSALTSAGSWSSLKLTCGTTSGAVSTSSTISNCHVRSSFTQ